MRGDFKRQAALFNPFLYKDTPVVLIGVGGIGSGVLMGLAKMGISDITVFDHDYVEPHNIPNQFYMNTDIGESKVEAAYRIAKQFSPEGIEISINKEKATPQTILPKNSLVIFATDSLAARKELFTSGFMVNAGYLIDARMGGNVISLYNVDVTSDFRLASYAESLEVKPHKTSCAAQAISYTILLTAGLVCSSVRNVLVGNVNPFNVVLDAQNFMLQVETGQSANASYERERDPIGV
jgi:molybdopterin/thiamine biosynthesis adenylyltransferase